MALTTAQIQNAYVAFFNRPADVAGLTYWSTYAGSTADLLNTFAQSAEYKSLYSGLNNTQTVNAVYQNLFGHAPDVAGLQYWVTQLDQGKLAIGNIADAINKGAQGTDATIISNKVTAATAFTVALDTTAEIVAYAGVNSTGLTAVKNWLAAVTADSATLTSATSTTNLNAITTTVLNNVASTGSTYTLTTGADNIVGSSGNDKIAGVISGTSVALTAVDAIDGGAGLDTLAVQTDASVSSLNLANVEVVSVTATANTPTISLAGVTGVTTVENNASASALSFTNVAAVGTVSVKNSAVNTTVSYAEAAVAGSADVATLNLNNVTGAATVNIDSATALGAGVETVAINTTGAASSITLQSVDSTITKITAAGDQNLTLALGTSGGNVSTSAVTIDGSAATGKLTISGFGAANHTVTGGSGNDTFTFGLNFNANDAIDGGAGTDTLGITSSGTQTAITAAQWAKVKNVEVVSFTSDGTNQISQDASLLTGVNAFTVVAAGGTENYTLSNLSAAPSVTVTGQGATAELLTLALKDATGLSDSLTVNLGVATETNATGVTLANLTNPAGVETVNIVSLGSSNGTTNTVTTTAASGKLVLSGDASLTVGAVTAATQIDASALKGVLTLGGGTAYAIAGGNIQSGSGNDVITAGAGAQTINGGAGNDTITGGAGADVLTGGAGTDTFGSSNNFAAQGQGVAASANTLTTTIANGQTLTFGSGVDIITDFVSGTDKLDVATAATAATSLIGVNGTAAGTNNTTYAVAGTYNTATGVFTIDTTATASTANVATLVVVGDGAANLNATTGWVILTGVASLAAADFI